MDNQKTETSTTKPIKPVDVAAKALKDLFKRDVKQLIAEGKLEQADALLNHLQ